MTRERLRHFGAEGLCILGVLIVGYAGVQCAKGAYRADAVRREWEAQQARATVALARERAASDVSAAIEHVATGAPVARLQIPRIHLDEIVVEGVGDNELNTGPGHLPGSVLPGMLGNAVISAHRDRHFHQLDELRVGDTIQTETGQSHGAWVVVGRRVIQRDTPALFDSKGPMLTLTTCWPVRYFGSAPDRLIISATPIAGTWTESPSRRPGAT